MENNQFELNFENKRLEQTLSIVQDQLSSARLNLQEKEAAIIASKQDMWENTTHSVSGLYSAQDFLDFVELSQYANPVAGKISEHETEAHKIWRLERMVNSPYFARIDFKFDGEDGYEKIYIGRSSLMDEKSHEIYVYDWRSPIASIFYRFGTGKAFYKAPAGETTGEVNLKRQYEIKRSVLEYFFDADVQIIDEFLRKLLSQNTSSKMKAIVETIQKDQDMVIRDMEHDLVMVQGVAGSGKTSVALHRAAYLMYQGLSAKLSANNIVIISPNALFEQYISNVLPELGEKQVNTLVFEDIYRTVLKLDSIQTKHQFLESLISCDDKRYQAMMKKSMEFKGSSQFVEVLNRFIHDLPLHWIEFSDVYYDGKYIANRQLSKARILAGRKSSPLAVLLKQLEASILKVVHRMKKDRIDRLRHFVMRNLNHSLEVEEVARLLSIEESTVLIKAIRTFAEVHCLDLYKKLFADRDYFYRLARGIDLPGDMDDIIDFTCENLQRGELPYDDAGALTLMHLKIYGSHDFKPIRQVVVDEAQDYYPLQFELLKELFPKARYTVLGDINQTIGKQEDLSLYQQIGRRLGKEKSALITMDKSFRCTHEIMMYSGKFIEGAPTRSFSRNGDMPAVNVAPSPSELEDMIVREVKDCREKGYESIGVICKTEREGLSLYERLKDRIHIRPIHNDSGADLKGTFIIPVYMAKGLEFDAVLIVNTDREHYHSDDDKKLLYIACTRALHRLNLFYAGTVSPLL